MKSPNICNRNTRAFTLIEVIVVIALLALFASMGLMFSFDSYRGYLFRSEYVTTVNLLAKARNRAINNFNESSHGVYIDDDEYVLFVGDSYATRDTDEDEIFPRSAALEITGVPPSKTIVFEQLSGDLEDCTTDPCTVTFAYATYVKTIEVNDVGGIDW